MFLLVTLCSVENRFNRFVFVLCQLHTHTRCAGRRLVPGWLFLTAGCWSRAPTSPYPYAKYTSIQLTLGVGLDPEAADWARWNGLLNFSQIDFFHALLFHFTSFISRPRRRPHFRTEENLWRFSSILISHYGRNGPELAGNRLNQFSAVTLQVDQPGTT